METATAIIGSDSDQRAKNAFHSQVARTLAPHEIGVRLSFPDPIPTGKRLIIETVAVRIATPKGQWALLGLVTTLAKKEHLVPLAVSQGPALASVPHVYSAATHNVRLYTDSLELNVDRMPSNAVDDCVVWASVDGYLEKL